MCTRFIFQQKNNTIAAMNFDNDTMKFEVNKRNPDIFVVNIAVGSKKMPSFGVNSKGVFINSQFVEENEKGKYRRGKNVYHMTRFIQEVLNGKIDHNEFDQFLAEKEIVNVPNLNCHSLLSDGKGHSWIIEPGIGVRKQQVEEGRFAILTNSVLFSSGEQNSHDATSCKRYTKVREYLNKKEQVTIKDCFHLLESVKQTGEWHTDFSFVYSQKTHTVHYCYGSQFDKVEKHRFS